MPVVVTLSDHVAVIQMDDAPRRNALGPAMLDGLTSAFASLSPDIRAVVLRSVPGSAVWCAGFDITQLSPGADPLAQSGPLQALFRQVQACPAPVIAMLHGTAWGGGTDLALRCDLAVADPTCSLAFTPARLGLPYDADGLLNVMLRAGSAVAIEMFATAEPVPAARALQLGLVNHLVPEAELEGFTMALARRIAANAPLSVASAKQQIRALAESLPIPAAVSQRLHEGRRRALDSADYAEGLAAFAAKRKPVFRGE